MKNRRDIEEYSLHIVFFWWINIFKKSTRIDWHIICIYFIFAPIESNLISTDFCAQTDDISGHWKVQQLRLTVITNHTLYSYSLLCDSLRSQRRNACMHPNLIGIVSDRSASRESRTTQKMFRVNFSHAKAMKYYDLKRSPKKDNAHILDSVARSYFLVSQYQL